MARIGAVVGIELSPFLLARVPVLSIGSGSGRAAPAALAASDLVVVEDFGDGDVVPAGNPM